MKQANNNEMDLLLRSLARGRNQSQLHDRSLSSDGGEVFSDHLDADELNSFAEGVAPAPARARYTEHLADCGACRSIVVSLTQASGAASRYDVQEQKSGSTFWNTLAALFSPAVLRYAVPALVLTAVIGIGFFALRPERRPDLVAQNPAVESRSTAVPNTYDTPTPATNATPLALPTEARPEGFADSEKDEGNLRGRKTPAAEAPTVATESAAAKPMAAKDSAQPGADTGVATTLPYSAEPKAGAPAPPAVTLGRADKSGELAKEQPARREEQERSRDAFRTQTDDVHGPNRSRSNTQQMPATGTAGGLMGDRVPSGPNKNKVADKKVGADESRTVSGRRFTREGSSWVDTDYDSSRATIRVARGSDQFRALVADEPGIRNIAEQLNGIVIVIWKNRAYRIQ